MWPCWLAFGLGSYNIIIIEAGHITKAWAMAMMAPVLAAELLCLKGAGLMRTDRKKAIHSWVWGGILFTLALGLQIALNHIQITFYTAIAGVIMGAVYIIYAIKQKHLPQLLASIGILVVGVLLALACNTRHLFVNQEYMAYTMRGGSEITVTPQDLYGQEYPRNNNSNDKGLDINYLLQFPSRQNASLLGRPTLYQRPSLLRCHYSLPLYFCPDSSEGTRTMVDSHSNHSGYTALVGTQLHAPQ